MVYKDVEARRKIVKEFIREHPDTTWKEIKKELHTNIGKVYPRGLKDAFLDAGVRLPRCFETKTDEEKRKLVIECIKRSPGIGIIGIRKKLKISVSNVFSSIKEAYRKAGVDYPREESYKISANEKRKRIIEMIKNDPNTTIQELSDKIKTNPYHLFKNLNEIYDLVGVKRIGLGKKRKLRKKIKVIDFIKKNPLVTQREINKICKTKVQELFEGGIFDAYKHANVEFPYERLRVHGSAIKEIRDRARKFEEFVSIKLSGYGTVNRLIQTERGIADIIFERKNKKAVIEVKDYLAKDISMSEVKQLNRYLEDCGCNIGFLVCHQKSKKDKFLIGKNKIILLNESELNQIPQIIDMGS